MRLKGKGNEKKGKGKGKEKEKEREKEKEKKREIRGQEGHLHDGVDTTAVPLPHAPETGLATNIPELHGDIALGDLTHVEAHSGDHVLLEGSVLRRDQANRQ